MTDAHAEFVGSYRDARSLDAPAARVNRLRAYRRSFAVGRAERAVPPIPTARSQVAAAEAEQSGQDR